MERLVIVGASLAGLRAAQAARSAGYNGGLVLIGDEPHLPYTRPPLSKELLSGIQTLEQTAFPLGELEVDWRLGSAAAGLDRDAKRVLLDDDHDVAYDRLIVATGCRARSWRGPGSALSGVHTLRTLEDAASLGAELVPGRRLLIVGAGFIGCEVAASARRLGLDVTLVDIAPHPMLPLGPELGERWIELHRGNAIDLRLGVGIDSLHGDPSGDNGRVHSATLADGTQLDVDVVLIALGSQLNSEWLADSGLEFQPGIVTDATLTTTADPDVFAVGDIAAPPVALAGGVPTRIEHWTTAAEHGQLAGRNALLEPHERSSHVNPPYFWSDQHGIKIQAVGCPGHGQRTVELERSPDGAKWVCARVRDDRVVGIVAAGAARRLAFYRKLLTSAPPLADVQRQLAAADSGALGAPLQEATA